MKTTYEIFAVRMGSIIPVPDSPKFENELLALNHISELLNDVDWECSGFIVLPVYSKK